MIFAGSGCKVEVRLQNLSGRSRLGVLLEDSGPAHRLDWYLDHLEGHARRLCRGAVVLPGRGCYDFGPIVATSGHPFGLIRRRQAVSEMMRVVVLPRMGKLSRDRLRQQLRGADPSGERVHRHGWRHEAAQADFHGLRPFRLGDSPRWIHWRTSARRGELIVREMEDVPGDDLLLVFDACGPAGDHFEEAVSLAATIVWEWCRRRGDRLVLAVAGPSGELHAGLTGPEHARKLLECLARIEPATSAGAGAVDDWCCAAPTTSGVIVVAAGPSDCQAVLEQRLGRSVTLLDVTRRQEWTFYSSGREADGSAETPHCTPG